MTISSNLLNGAFCVKHRASSKDPLASLGPRPLSIISEYLDPLTDVQLFHNTSKSLRAIHLSVPPKYIDLPDSLDLCLKIITKSKDLKYQLSNLDSLSRKPDLKQADITLLIDLSCNIYLSCTVKETKSQAQKDIEVIFHRLASHETTLPTDISKMLAFVNQNFDKQSSSMRLLNALVQSKKYSPSDVEVFASLFTHIFTNTYIGRTSDTIFNYLHALATLAQSPSLTQEGIAALLNGCTELFNSNSTSGCQVPPEIVQYHLLTSFIHLVKQNNFDITHISQTLAVVNRNFILTRELMNLLKAISLIEGLSDRDIETIINISKCTMLTLSKTPQNPFFIQAVEIYRNVMRKHEH